MKTSRKTTLRTEAFVLLAGFAVAACDMPNGGHWPQRGTASIDDAPRAAEVGPAEGLRLALRTEKPEYEIGEPVYAIIVLTNDSQRARRVFGRLRPEDEAVAIRIVGGSGEDRLFRPLGYSDNDYSAWVDLGPGEQVGATAPIFFGSDGWTFTEEGRYQLTATYTTTGDGSRQQVRSGPFTLSIAAGEEFVGEGDGAGALLTAGDSASLEAGKFLTWQSGDHLVAGRQLLNDVLSRWPESRVASHAAFALGRSWSEPFMDYRSNEVRPPNCQRARALLESVDRDVLGKQARTLVEIALARCAAVQDDYRRALLHLDRGREIAGEAPELAGLRARIDEYAGNLSAREGA